MRPLYLVVALVLLTPLVVGAQSTDEWRARFAAGEEARRTERFDVYASEMAAAARALPPGHGNRPFVQYHAARAAALAGDAPSAVDWLRRVWEEDIEALMISFADYDPAFTSLVDAPGYREVMGLAEGMQLTTRPLGGATYLIGGAGSNVIAQIGADGVLLVDVGYRPAIAALRRAVRSLGGRGVDRIVVTHAHEDHVGSTPDLGAEAVIMAHPAAAAAMREEYVFMEGVTLPPKPEVALPDVEIAADTTFSFNGDRIRVVPTSAHTAGDLTVYFSGARVAALGDTYLAAEPMMFPGGEDPAGFLDRLEALLDSMDPETVVVGGHGDPAGLADVRAQIAVSRACMDLAARALDDGLTLEQAIERGADRFPPQWVSFFYRALERRRR